MSAPVHLTTAPRVEGLSRSESAGITADRSFTQETSFAAAIEKGLNDSEKVGQRTRELLDPDLEAHELQGEMPEPFADFPLLSEDPTLASGDEVAVKNQSADLAELGLSYGLPQAIQVPAAAFGKNLPESEPVGETPSLAADAHSQPADATLGGLIAQKPHPFSGLEPWSDGEGRIGISEAKAGKAGIVEGGSKIASMLGEKETAGATQVDLKGSAGLESSKGIEDAARSSMSQKPFDQELLAFAGGGEDNSALEHSEQRAGARPEMAQAVGGSLQKLGGNSMSASAPPPTLVANSQMEWSDGLSNQVRWMLGRQSSVAELKLTPRELGSMEVRIALDKEATSIQFLVQNVAAKEMVEDALPRLRVLLADVGVNLQDVGVREHTHTGSEQQQDGRSGSANGDGLFTEGEGHVSDEASEGFAGPSTNASDQIIDAYA